jgi:hypothetical protein
MKLWGAISAARHGVPSRTATHVVQTHPPATQLYVLKGRFTTKVVPHLGPSLCMST